MVKVRPATHAGSWYSGNPNELNSQLSHYLSLAKSSGKTSVKGARVLVGPHAGYSFAGKTLAQTYNSFDPTGIKRVFIMGPSHHIYFKDEVRTTRYGAYATPLGNVPVDTDTIKDLVSNARHIEYMSSSVDENEHSFELHMPLYYKACLDKGLSTPPPIIPILISGFPGQLADSLTSTLQPYFEDKENAFFVSTDFCHWGDRFGYTSYTPNGDLESLDDVSLAFNGKSNSLKIYESIEAVDKKGMELISKGDVTLWRQYLQATENTICGAYPLTVLLKLMGKADTFEWLGYTQSSHVLDPYDSSVSYASGYAVPA
ncbi:BA75_00072T0 [Komagataella pastoris]|uniref:BA75_00072T0 n=1 Tax=Komagataella pastoris TaxID=4922 RepID=A0A1B2J910_PICPA|nr:BA75_00072T0 [Komagataella pastoris]